MGNNVVFNLNDFGNNLKNDGNNSFLNPVYTTGPFLNKQSLAIGPNVNDANTQACLAFAILASNPASHVQAKITLKDANLNRVYQRIQDELNPPAPQNTQVEAGLVMQFMSGRTDLPYGWLGLRNDLINSNLGFGGPNVNCYVYNMGGTESLFTVIGNQFIVEMSVSGKIIETDVGYPTFSQKILGGNQCDIYGSIDTTGTPHEIPTDPSALNSVLVNGYGTASTSVGLTVSNHIYCPYQYQ